MAICPFAVQQIIPESYTQGRINPTTLIFHEAVSSADSLRDYWNSPGVELESHFYIGRTGVIYQFVDTNVRADANADANGFAVSVETWDDSNRDPLLGWNDDMRAACKRLAAWVCDTHGIRKAPAATWNGGGIGGHNWFPYPWAQGPRQCPGQTRNAQLRNDIIPAVANGYDWQTQEDDVPFDSNSGNVEWAAGDPWTPNHVEKHKVADWIGWGAFHTLAAIRKIDALTALVAADRDISPEELQKLIDNGAKAAAAAQVPMIVAGISNQLAPLVQQALELVQAGDNAAEVEELLRRIATLVPTGGA